MRFKSGQNGFAHFSGLLLLVIVVSVIGFAGYKVVSKNKDSVNSATTNVGVPANEKAIAAGRQLSSDYCKGTGETTFTHLPMDASDFSLLIPYGETVGGHVTPIDHQYFSPTVFNSAKDTYPVYAMADSDITTVEVHPTRIRIIFTVSCTFLYYYDLVTSVQPGIDDKHLPIHVKAGQIIGHIGGQTLDFAVWNTKKPLSGFVNPDSYKGEAWKIYTDNPFPYYREDLRKIVESKNPRTAAPTQGKIDYDIDGKLIGNWFLQGSGGYSGRGDGPTQYWGGHLSIAPDEYDPSVIVVSVGNYDSYPGANPDSSRGDGSGARQYFTLAGSPDPAGIGVGKTIKYELVSRGYKTSDGSLWNQSSITPHPKVVNTGQPIGTVMAELTDKRTLKFEVFKGKTADQVAGFDSNAKTYTR